MTALRDAGEEAGLATVYRVLTQFDAAGLVTRHNFEAGAWSISLCSNWPAASTTIIWCVWSLARSIEFHRPS